MGRWRRLTQPNYTFLDYQKSRVQGKNLDSVCRYSYNANDLVICFSVNGGPPSSILLVGLPTPSLATPSFLTGGDLALRPAARFPCHPISTASPDMTDAAGQ